MVDLHRVFFFHEMRRTRADFKSALKYCKKHEEQIKADLCEHSLDLKDSKAFWKNVHRDASKKVTGTVLSVGAASGIGNVANMWKDHFAKLYNCIDNEQCRVMFYDNLNSMHA
jgi:tryptophan 2,3-dioxygenase